MYPVILQLGPIIIYTLWLFVGISFLVGVILFTQLAKQRRLNMEFIYDNSILIFLITVISARLIFLASNYQFYFQDFTPRSLLSVLYIWDKGLSVLGGLLGLVLGIMYFSHKNKEQTKKWLDILTISVIFAMGIAHIGTFLDGSFYGNPTNMPWGILFESPSIKYAVPIHPVQLYAALFSLAIASGLYILYKKNIYKKGTITNLGLISYAFMLFLLGFFRGDDVQVILSIRSEQWFALLILILTGSYIYYSYNKDKKKISQNPKES